MLVNDYLLCATVNGRPSEVDFNNTTSANERLSLKWAAPVTDVEVIGKFHNFICIFHNLKFIYIDGTAGGTLARLLAAGSISAGSKRSSLGRSSTPASSHSLNGSSSENGQAENLAQDMNDLMHDFDVVSRIAGMIGTMKGKYEGLTTDVTNGIMAEIQKSIRQKDEEMSWVDACCLQIAIKGKSSKDKTETFTFQTRDPNVKKEWIVGKKIQHSRVILTHSISALTDLKNYRSFDRSKWSN